MIGVTRSSLLAEVARQSGLGADIARAQVDISSQKRLQADSDDPVAAARVAVIRRDQANRAVWSANLAASATAASAADNALASVSNAVQHASELVTQAANGTLNDDNRATIAAELSGLVDEVAGYMAAKDSRGNPVFPDGAAIRVPVGEGRTLAATDTKSAVFGALLATLRTAADAVAAGQPGAISASLPAVNAAGDGIASQRGLQGVRGQQIDAAQAAMQSGDIALAAERSGLEDTDLAATVTKLQAKLVTLQAAQAVFAQLNKQTLFDKLG